MEDDINFFQMENIFNFVLNKSRHQFVFQMEDIEVEVGLNNHVSGKWPQVFQMEDDFKLF